VPIRVVTDLRLPASLAEHLSFPVPNQSTHVPTSRLIADSVQTAPKDQDPLSRCHRLSPLVRLRQQTKTADEPHTPWRRRPFSPLASVSRVLDFGPAARAHAFVPLGPRRSKAHVSSAHGATAPALRQCAVRYWHCWHSLALFLQISWPDC
jgi:hypothetical protein